jgi:hypothetical protein
MATSTTDLRVAVRVALVSTITAALVGSPYAGIPVLYRPTRKAWQVPSVTFFDQGDKIDNVVPLYHRTFYFSAWSLKSMDDAEALAHLVNGVFDHQGIVLPNQEGLIAHFMLQADRDQPGDDGDVNQKILTYTMLVYEYNGPAPSSG